jgi:signal transduction histidine kinase
MNEVKIQPEKFSFEILPLYADFILREKLEVYVRHSIQFAKEEDLPIMRQLSKFSDEELTALSIESSREILTALAKNSIHELIQANVKKWIANKLEIIDKDSIEAEDLTLVAFIRRKALSCFLSDFTKDKKTKIQLIHEIDIYTTQEEMVSYNAYIRMQQEKLNKANQYLAFQEILLLEAQEITEMGSFYVDYINPENSIATPQMSKITGLPVAAKAETFFQFVHPDDVAQLKSAWENAFASGGNFEHSYRYIKDKVEKRLVSKGIVKFENGRPVNLRGTLRDITKEYELIQKLTESETLHKQAQELTHLGNWSWNMADNTISWSDEMYRIYGLIPQAETITFERFVSLIHPDDREGRIAEINESLQTGHAKDYKLKIVTPAGEIKILSGHGNIETDANGNPIKLNGTCQDITKDYYLNEELQSLNSSLSEKNEELVNINRELESFNYIASHDLQEPLRKIQLFTGRLMDQSENLSEEMAQSLQKVVSSAARMQRLIADLIEFSQISAPSEAFEIVDLNPLVEEVKATLYDASENLEAVFRIDKLPKARVIPFQFMQLLTNIISNALKYKKDGVIPEITIKYATADSKNEPGIQQGSYMKLSICDNGIGFEPEQQENIFDLFKRLHPNEKYSGTGIGLAICKKIVQNHNGFITAQSEKGKGSCFHIYLPYQKGHTS